MVALPPNTLDNNIRSPLSLLELQVLQDLHKEPTTGLNVPPGPVQDALSALTGKWCTLTIQEGPEGPSWALTDLGLDILMGTHLARAPEIALVPCTENGLLIKVGPDGAQIRDLTIPLETLQHLLRAAEAYHNPRLEPDKTILTHVALLRDYMDFAGKSHDILKVILKGLEQGKADAIRLERALAYTKELELANGDLSDIARTLKARVKELEDQEWW